MCFVAERVARAALLHAAVATALGTMCVCVCACVCVFLACVLGLLPVRVALVMVVAEVVVTS